MRNLVILSMLLASCVLVEAKAVTQQVEGYWSNSRHQVQVQVERTPQGIRVLRIGQSRWRQYREVRNNQFQDQQGNTYYVLSNGQLEWESSDGRKRIQFNRSNSRNRTYQRGRSYSSRNDWRGGNRVRRAVQARDLQGTWVNYWNDDCLFIRSRRGALRVRGLGFGSRTFHAGPNGFEDHKGNLIQLDRRRLVLINRRGKIRGSFYRR
ncbi:MAG: hypothetical protein KTR24_16740 [Saprospiraceae bacterium]|nr:hypothetical protein [Saprospiraceae bacterium]